MNPLSLSYYTVPELSPPDMVTVAADQGFAHVGLRLLGGQPDGDPMPLLADPERMHAIGRAGLDALLAVPGVDTGRLAAIGYGAGGRIVLELARTGTPFAAVAVVHPALPASRADDWTDVGAAFLLCTGSEDPLCTPEQLMSFASVLQEAGRDWYVNIYGGAQHAFWAAPMSSADALSDDGTPDRPAATVPGVGHHAAHARRAWRAVLDLLDDTLRRSDSDERP